MCSLARQFVLTFAVSGLCSAYLSAQSAAAVGPIRIKVVIVTMFERGEDTDDAPGEFQLWVEREHLDQILPLPSGYHQLRLNKSGVLGMVTGVGTAKAAASVMALGLDPRFELSKAYWIVAGIGGGDPADVSVGSAVWANHVVDGDLVLRSMRDKFQRAGRLVMYHYKKEVLTSSLPATFMVKRTH
jgi:purine nucleoside permease